MALKPSKQPSLSNDAGDKMAAAMNWPIGKSRDGSSYRQAPKYFDECWAWYQRLTPEQQDWCTYVADAFTHWGMGGREALRRQAAGSPEVPL